MTKENQNSIEVVSPCVGNCCLNECDICLGCFRHIEEIKAWRASNKEEKESILARCDKRKKAMPKLGY